MNEQKIKHFFLIKIPKFISDVTKSALEDLSKSIVIAILTSIFLFSFNKFNEHREGIKTTNNIIKSICLGESKDYIISLMGKPRFEFIDDGLCNSFFPLEYIIVRCVFDKNDLIVGYFITAKEKNTALEIHTPIDKDKRLIFGQDTIDSFSLVDSIKEGNVANGGMALSKSYYWEYTFLAGVGNYQNYIVALLPYGFADSGSIRIMFSAQDYSENEDLIESYRKIYHPNTYGIVTPRYMDRIHPIIENKDLEVLWVSCVENLILY